MDATQFLTTLYEFADSGHTQIFALPSKQARAVPVDDLSQVQSIVSSITGQNIFYSPGICAHGEHRRWGVDDIIGIPALWVDIDIYNPQTHKKDNLPKTVAEAMTLIPDNINPSIIIHSGYGLHVYWQFKEIWYFDTPEEKKQAQDLSVNMQAVIRQSAAANGWHLDSTADLSRVMRVPGTLNHKIPERPVLVQVIESSDVRYDPSELIDSLPAVTETSTYDKNRPRQYSFERRPTDGPAEYMLHNCAFMQHVQLNAKTLSYGEWLAALTNIVRATDGIEAAHAVSAIDTARYNPKDCDKKIDECLQAMQPQNCDYIRNQLGFQGCPNGCDIKAPCGWSLGTVSQAKAKVKTIITPTPETVNNPEILGALALLQQKEALFFDDFMGRYSGNKAALKKELTKYKREAAGFSVIDGQQPEGAAPAPNIERWLSQLVPDIPIDLVLPGNPSQYASWSFKNDGVSAMKINDQGNVTYNKATYVPIIINERISNIDTNQEKASLSFRTHRGNWRNVILPKSTIFDAKKIMCLADSGLVVTSDTAKILTKWLSELEAANTQIIPDRVGVSKFGWRNNDTEFICPGMCNNYVLDTDDIAPQSVIDGYSVAGDHGTWLQAMGELRKNPKARFILAASFAAPLLKITGQRIFGVHNWGDSRDGKSAAQYAALSVWGKPDVIKILASSSETGIERMAALCSDLPLCISELETLDEHRRAEFENKTIYMVTEGRGKQRGTIKGLQQSASWRTIMITNAESPIVKDNSKGGIITRIIEINGGPFINNQDFASYLYGVMERNYGHAGRIFLSNIITANHADIKDIYNKLRFTLKKKYPEKIDSHIDAVSHTALGDQLSSMWVYGEDKDTASRGALQTAEYIIENHLINNGDADESERAWQWMLGWIAANNGRFTMNARSAIPILGYIDDGYICILKTEIAKAMKEQGFNPDKIFRKWADANRIPITKVGDKRTFAVRGKRINGVQPWILRIKEEGTD